VPPRLIQIQGHYWYSQTSILTQYRNLVTIYCLIVLSTVLHQKVFFSCATTTNPDSRSLLV